MFEFTARTPFRLPEVRDGTRSLIAFGIEAKEIIPTMRVMGDVAAVAQLGIKELSDVYGIARAEQQQFAKDLRQFASRGIPIFDLLSEQLGYHQGCEGAGQRRRHHV